MHCRSIKQCFLLEGLRWARVHETHQPPSQTCNLLLRLCFPVGGHLQPELGCRHCADVRGFCKGEQPTADALPKQRLVHAYWLTRLLRDSTSTVNVMIPRQWSGLNASELAYTHTFLDSHTEQYTNIIYIVEQKYWCQVAIKFRLAMPVWRFESGMR